MNKRGDKYYWIISLILGIMVLSLSIYFLFNEYFVGDTSDQEMCRQSIILRNVMPDGDTVASKLTVSKAKETLPLKCTTQVVTVDDSYNLDDALKEVGDSIYSCWYMFGEGTYKIFPPYIVEARGDCIACSRIHFTQEFLDKYNTELESLSKQKGVKLDDGSTIVSLQSYLSTHSIGGEYVPKGNKNYYVQSGLTVFGESIKMPTELLKTSNVNGRENIDFREGDLIISYYSYSNPELFGRWAKGDIKWATVLYSYNSLFIFQSEKDELDFCTNWEGVPA